MNYIVSQYGLGVCVGLTDASTAHLDINLAHNLFNSYANHNVYHGSINFNSFKQFKKFLILKEYFKIWDEHVARNKVSGRRDQSNIIQFTRRAIKRAKLIIDSNVRFENFMSQISSSNNHYSIGSYQDETGEE